MKCALPEILEARGFGRVNGVQGFNLGDLMMGDFGG